MRKNLLCGFLFLGFHFQINSQQTDLNVSYGRFWAPYKHSDQGSGFREQSKSNYNFFPSIGLNKYYSDKFSLEFLFLFTLYEQYYSTRKYTPAFESSYSAGHIVTSACLSLLNKNNIEMRVKGGLGLGIMGNYEGTYVEMFIFPSVDSITRGNIHRDFTPVFPMLSAGFDFSWKISARTKLVLAGTYQKGFIRITEYDIYYNDGTGSNDQRAKQWGSGDFYGAQLGIRYILKKK